MLQYFRIWQLVRYVHIKTIGNAEENREEIIEQIMLNNAPAVIKRKFIDDYSKFRSLKVVQVESILGGARKRKLVRELHYPDADQNLVHVIKTTITGDEFVGIIPLLEGLLKEFKLSWTLIVIPIVAFIVGKYWNTISNWLFS
jgi:hypothetical protein